MGNSNDDQVNSGDGANVEAIQAFAGVEADSQLSYFQMVRQSKKLILYGSLASVGPMMFGFDNIIVGVVTALPFFQTTFGEPAGDMYILPALWLGLWNSLTLAGVMVGAAFNGHMIDRFGRRLGFLVGGCIATGAIGIVYAADTMSTLNGRRGIFLLGKIILGIALGVLISTSQTYLSEIAPTRLRGALLASYTLFMRVAVFETSAFKVPFAAQWAFSGFAILCAFLIPESPAYHLKRGNIDSARASYGRLVSSKVDVDSQFAILQASLVLEQQRNGALGGDAHIRECFRGPDRRRTIIIVVATLLQQLLGISLISNSTYFLQLAGMSPRLSLIITQASLGLVLVANVVSWYTISRFGRRRIMLVSTVAVGLLWLSVGNSGCFHSSTALWYIGVGLIVIGTALQSGVGSAWPVVTGETSSLRLRSKSQTVAWISNAFWSWLFSFFVPYLFDTQQANLGGKIGFFFAGTCLIAFLFIWFLIPEMKNRSYTDLDEMFANVVPTRKFADYVCHSEQGIAETIVDMQKGQVQHKE